MGAYYNMVNDFGEGIATFLAMLETRQIALPMKVLPQVKIQEKSHQIVKQTFY